MGHDDKVETIRDAKDIKQERSEGVALTVVEAHTEKALGTLHAQKMTDFLSQKTNIDKVTVDDKTVDLADGKHERERGTIKDAAKAMEKGDVQALQKAFDGLSPEQAKTVAAGLDKALRPGAAVGYDGDNTPPTIDIYTNPAKLGDSRSQKIMIPTDGEGPRRALGETPYDEASQKAKSEDFKKVMDGVQKADQERKQLAGLTMDKKSSALLTMDLAENEAVPLFREVKQTAAPEKTDSTLFTPDKPPVSTSPLEKHANSDGSGYASRDGKIVWISSADASFGYHQASTGTSRFLDYDDNGNLKQVAEYQGETGAIWNKQENGQWTDGYGHTRKDMAVAKDGTITYTDSDGAKVTARVDGTSTHKFPDGRVGVGHSDGSYEEKDKAGHFTKTRDAKYENHYDKHGNVTSTTKLEQVNASGGLVRQVEGDTTYYAKDGHKTKISHHDGRSEEYDKQGHITKATDAHKHSVEFKYDEAGHASITKHGKHLPAEVYSDGSYTYKDSKAGVNVTHYRDGSEIQTNDKGQVEAVTDAKGHAYSGIKYDDQGHVTEIRIDGTTWKDPKHSGKFEDGNGHTMSGEVKVDPRSGDILVHKRAEPKVSYEDPVDYVIVHQKDGTERQDLYEKDKWK